MKNTDLIALQRLSDLTINGTRETLAARILWKLLSPKKKYCVFCIPLEDFKK